jgi:hypothetical protein
MGIRSEGLGALFSTNGFWSRVFERGGSAKRKLVRLDKSLASFPWLRTSFSLCQYVSPTFFRVFGRETQEI